MANHKKQFCPQGHDTFVTGRNKKNQCIECKKHPMPIKKIRNAICSNGHDKTVVGIYKDGKCKACVLKRCKKHHENNKEKINASRRLKWPEYIKNHPLTENQKERKKITDKEWVRNNREHINTSKREKYDPVVAHEAYIRNKEGIYKWQASIEGKFSHLRSITKRKKLPFDLTIETYAVIIDNGCFYCGVSLIGTKGISLDKINYDGGYTIDNILPCCRPCNFIRNRLHTVQETLIMVRARSAFRKFPQLFKVFIGLNVGFIKSPFIDEDSWYPNRSKIVKKPITTQTRYKNFLGRQKIEHVKISIPFQEYAKLISNPCHYCSGSVLSTAGRGLDKIDSSKEYDLENVLPCCFVCNTIKGSKNTVEETKVMVIVRNLFRKKFISLKEKN